MMPLDAHGPRPPGGLGHQGHHAPFRAVERLALQRLAGDDEPVTDAPDDFLFVHIKKHSNFLSFLEFCSIRLHFNMPAPPL